MENWIYKWEKLHRQSSKKLLRNPPNAMTVNSKIFEPTTTSNSSPKRRPRKAPVCLAPLPSRLLYTFSIGFFFRVHAATAIGRCWRLCRWCFVRCSLSLCWNRWGRKINWVESNRAWKCSLGCLNWRLWRRCRSSSRDCSSRGLCRLTCNHSSRRWIRFRSNSESIGLCRAKNKREKLMKYLTGISRRNLLCRKNFCDNPTRHFRSNHRPTFSNSDSIRKDNFATSKGNCWAQTRECCTVVRLLSSFDNR